MKTIQKIIICLIFLSIFIIQCSNGTSNGNAKTLSETDIEFINKVKNKIVALDFSNVYIFEDNGNIKTPFEEYIFDCSEDGSNAYYYYLYEVGEEYLGGPNETATNYSGFSVNDNIIYLDYSENSITKWAEENYYSGLYEVKENPNFDNFPYENKSDIKFKNLIMFGVLINSNEYKPEEIGNITDYDFNGTYKNDKNAFLVLNKEREIFSLYAINIFTNENGSIITNIQNSSKRESHIGLYESSLVYEEYMGRDGGYNIEIMPISEASLTVIENNGDLGFKGIFNRTDIKIEMPTSTPRRNAVSNQPQTNRAPIQEVKDNNETFVESRANESVNNVIEKAVYISKTGKKYHVEDCRTLRGEKEAIDLNEALTRGYEACKVCNP